MIEEDHQEEAIEVETGVETEAATEEETEVETEAATEEVLEGATEEVTEVVTEEATEEVTEEEIAVEIVAEVLLHRPVTTPDLDNLLLAIAVAQQVGIVMVVAQDRRLTAHMECQRRKKLFAMLELDTRMP